MPSFEGTGLEFTNSHSYKDWVGTHTHTLTHKPTTIYSPGGIYSYSYTLWLTSPTCMWTVDCGLEA